MGPNVMHVAKSIGKGKWVFLANISVGEGLQIGGSPLTSPFFPQYRTLAQLIQNSTDICGIEVSGEEHRLSLYADDVSPQIKLAFSFT